MDVKRLVFCSSKLGLELQTFRTEGAVEGVAIARVEQLYRFPKDQILAEIARYPNVKDVDPSPSLSLPRTACVRMDVPERPAIVRGEDSERPSVSRRRMTTS